MQGSNFSLFFLLFLSLPPKSHNGRGLCSPSYPQGAGSAFTGSPNPASSPISRAEQQAGCLLKGKCSERTGTHQQSQSSSAQIKGREWSSHTPITPLPNFCNHPMEENFCAFSWGSSSLSLRTRRHHFHFSFGNEQIKLNSRTFFFKLLMGELDTHSSHCHAFWA